jgi:hypothetical protein
MHPCPECGLTHDAPAPEPAAEVAAASVEIAAIEAERDLRLAEMARDDQVRALADRVAELEGRLAASETVAEVALDVAAEAEAEAEVAAEDAAELVAEVIAEEEITGEEDVPVGLDEPLDVAPAPAETPAKPTRSAKKRNPWWP